MSIVVIGVNHQTGPLAVLERFALNGQPLAKAIGGLCALPNVREAVVVSTCNRTEIYAVAEKFHGAYADICDFLCDLSGYDATALHPHLYSDHDEAAVRHLFEVACGLDSVVLGEHEILGQVRHAWEIAQREGGARGTLNLLFRHAVETGKRARTETSISRSTASVSHAAVELAATHLGGLSGRRVLVVGAGEMGDGIAVALRHAGVDEIVVMNRTADRARPLAERVGGRIAPWADMAAAIGEADVVLTSTGAPQAIITTDIVGGAMSARPGRPLLMVDIAVPRDIERSVGELAGVTVLDLDDLRAWAQRGLDERREEAERVRSIVVEEVDRFEFEARVRQASPLIAQLTARAEEIRAGEFDRLASKLADLSPEQREQVERLTHSIVAKLLHRPLVGLRADAGTPRGERNAAVVRDLFDLQ